MYTSKGVYMYMHTKTRQTFRVEILAKKIPAL